MKSKKIKRYTIVQSYGTEVEAFKDYSSAIHFIETLKTLNKSKKEKYFYSDYELKEQKLRFVVIYRKFLKLFEPDFLDEIDKSTTNYKNYIEFCRDKKLETRPINIALRSNGGVTILPVFYEKDKKYLENSYLRNAIIDRCLDSDFVYELFNDNYINKCKNMEVFYHLEKLLLYKNRVDNNTHSPEILIKPAYDFFNSFIKKENGSRNYRAKRYIAELIRNKEEMELREKERIESLIDSGQAHQYKLWDYLKH